ncbi:hypothetical protein [Umezawaea sp. Da 62-37]|uniref:DUF5983 family protein n=1 Tax=Umezawaea sp. Da 62-37 TaxID=3075927 RepID=UPI0028F71771|nr:hypothetical protein [Umezawaea sp. Da 62-37]WNV83096.1 hypothetical protein RM788_33570 [Umezawaea sp. Da 62-37]
MTHAIRTFLDLSTGHLREQTCRHLADYKGIIAHEFTYGWLMYIHDPDDDSVEPIDQADWPDELAPIIQLAQASGCDYVLFDADGPHADNLPVFAW